jgi:hypothetical protein
MGIEPTLSAWEAEVLPLNYTRDNKQISRFYHNLLILCHLLLMVKSFLLNLLREKAIILTELQFSIKFSYKKSGGFVKYSTSISEQELSAYLAQTTQVVVVQQKKWRLQMIAFFCAIVLLTGIALLQTQTLFEAFWQLHKHGILTCAFIIFALIIFISAFLQSHLQTPHVEIQDIEDAKKSIHYDIDLNAQGVSVMIASDKNEKTMHCLWAIIKKVYVFKDSIMILTTNKAKDQLLLPFHHKNANQVMSHLLDEMRMYLPASVFVNNQ